MATSADAVRPLSTRGGPIEDATQFLYRPIVFMEPQRVVAPESWLDYTPFAFWVVDALRPAVFVELGCHSGNSYASFAQAVQTLGLTTACYGVDTWRGDPHAGFFDESVFEEWSGYHDRQFGTFSQLIRATFDETAEHFADGAIDLLHLDGYHTFEAALHDFETWRPKLSDRGVILCHDINVRERDFGAWRLWERLREDYPSFEFLHGHGLGVLGIGPDLPEAVAWLLSLRSHDPAGVNTVRLFFSRLGAAVLGRFAAVSAQRIAQDQLAESDNNYRSELAAAREGHRTELAVRDEQQTRAAADEARLMGELGEANRLLAVVQADAAQRGAALTAAEEAVAERVVDIQCLTSSLSARDTELERREEELARVSARLTDLQGVVGTLSADLHERDARIERLQRDVERFPRALSVRDEMIAALETDVTALAEQLHRRNGRRREMTGRHDRAHLRLASSSLAPPERQPPTIVVVSHVGPWQPKAGNEYRIRRMFCWYRKQGYRIIPIIAPLPGEELPAEGVQAIAAEFGNAVQCHRDGKVEHILHDAPDVLASMDGMLTTSLETLLGEEEATDPRRRELLHIERAFCHDVVAATVLHLQRALPPHVLQVEYIWMTRLLPLVRADVLKVVDTVDVFSNIPQKVAAFGIRDVTIESAEEAERLRRADLAIAIHDDERAELKRLVPDVPVITAGVDFELPADQPAAPLAGHVLYVGSGNPRNRKGLEDFLRFAWPRVRHAVPRAQLLVAGRVADGVADGEVPGLRILGPVDDLAAQYQNAALVINPAVAGTGLKIKILEALCHFRPVVTWPAGVEGLDPELAAICLVARDWYEFSEHVIRALNATRDDPFTAESRAAIAKHVSGEHVYASLESTLHAFFKQHAND